MRIKDGVRFASPAMAMMAATMVVREVYRQQGYDHKFYISGGIEEHQHPSLHPYGAALDYGTKDIQTEFGGTSQGNQIKVDLANMIRDRLGDGFDVVFEPTDDSTDTVEHIHVEYQPKDWHR